MMKRVIILSLILLFCACGWWKQKAQKSNLVTALFFQHQLDSLQSQVFLRDSLNWEKEEWRSFTWFPDTLHKPVYFREHVKSIAHKTSQKVAKQQVYHEQEQQLQQHKEEWTKPSPTKRVWWILLILLILLGLGMVCWRMLK